MKFHHGGFERDPFGVEPSLLIALRSFYDQLDNQTLGSKKYPLKPLFTSTVAPRICVLAARRKPSSWEWRDLARTLHVINLDAAWELHTTDHIFDDPSLLTETLFGTDAFYARDIIKLAMMCTPEPDNQLIWSVTATFAAVEMAIKDCFQQGSERGYQAANQRRRTHTDHYMSLPKFCKYCGEFTEFMVGMSSRRSLLGHDVLIVPNSANEQGAEHLGTFGRSKMHCRVHATTKEAEAERGPDGPGVACNQPRGIHYDAAIKTEGRHWQTVRQLERDAEKFHISSLPWMLTHWLVYWRLHQNIAKARTGSYLGDSAANWMAEIERCFGDRLALVSELSPWDFDNQKLRVVTENVLSICFESRAGTHMTIIDEGSDRGATTLFSEDLSAVQKGRDWLFNAIKKPNVVKLKDWSGITADCAKNGFEALVDDLHVHISYLTSRTGDHFTLTVDFTPRVVLEQLAFVGRSG